MSKMDNLRAMREARYAENAARAKAPASAPQRTTKPTATAPVPIVETEETPESEETCGHKNMGGRNCTREKGHAAKSHRYS